jgi:hypothetical protein
VFSKSPWTKKTAGQIAALKLSDRWVGDLVQETGRPVQGYSWILVVQDIFSRKLYARPLRSKQPADVAAGLRSIFAEAGDEPQSFETDRGREFYGPVQTLLRQRNIDHFVSHPLQRNAHSTLDRAIASLRQTMSRMQIEEREEDDWVAVLDRAVNAYNRSSHAALGPASPEDVEGSELLQRVMERENAQKSHQNALKAQKIRADFENAGHFRLPAHPAQRQRGHQVRWGSAQAVALGSRLGKVEDLFGTTEVPIRQALPVTLQGPDREIPKTVRGGVRRVPPHLVEPMRAFVLRSERVTLQEFQEELRRLGTRRLVTEEMMTAFGLTRARGRWSF